MRGLTICAALIALTGSAMAESRSFYDRNGSYAGSSISRNGYSTFTNARGSYAGSSVTRGNTTTIYDARGSRAGTVTRR
jgi:hypothetical protein